ncbi:unnamed protein product [Caenorhabditis bovis]|uniref:Uncharacterized protein n=1 Tax=Caenorhabditis bovis TaxID=2654633 RepID=A0A8S1EKH6_9PELO|nr:unnamed protein product [Caenorhabditis bovis]
MTTYETVTLSGTENLPTFIKTILEPAFAYHTHELECEKTTDGSAFRYKYTVVVSKQPTTTTTKSSSTACNSCLSFQPAKCGEKVKCVMMVQIKFHIFYTDSFGKEAQHTFQYEFPSDATLRQVIAEFEGNYRMKTKQKQFAPRLSMCIGEVTRSNSVPITEKHLDQTIAELTNDEYIGKITFVADLINKF